MIDMASERAARVDNYKERNAAWQSSVILDSDWNPMKTAKELQITKITVLFIFIK
jgi:hypothetical protein